MDRTAVLARSCLRFMLPIAGSLGIVSIAVSAQETTGLQPDPPISCPRCEEWNRHVEPYRIFGNTYYVGVAGLSAVLITSDDGHILIDGALPQSAAVIDENIRALGFQTRDIKLIALSHEHYDHAGGIAALQRLSRAAVVAGSAATRALKRGEPTPDDPQFAFGSQANRFPSVSAVHAVDDGETLRVDSLAITAHATPGHTPGSTTWTWRSCETGLCYNIVYADSLNPVSAPEFKFGSDRTRVEQFQQSITKVATLSCDIVLSVHPEVADLHGKRRRRDEGSVGNPFVDSAACRAYANNAALLLERRLRTEQ